MLLIVARLRARYFREEGGFGCTREVGSVMPFGKMQNPVTFSYVLLGMQFSALMTWLVLYSWFCRLHTGIVKPWNVPVFLGKLVEENTPVLLYAHGLSQSWFPPGYSCPAFIDHLNSRWSKTWCLGNCFLHFLQSYFASHLKSLLDVWSIR